jgi:predicted ester cyclase
MKYLFVLYTGIVFLSVISCGEKADSTARNKQIIRRVFDELYNQGNLDVADEIYSTEYIWHNVSGPDVHGAEGMKEHVAMVRSAFPDIKITAEDMIGEGDKVVTRWMIVATHKGEFGGIPPSDVQVKFTGILISRIAGGKVVEDWENSDVLGLMQQLGVIPTPGKSSE